MSQALYARDEDDDAPPPLCSLQGQLEAAQAARSGGSPTTSSSANGDTLRVATVVVGTGDRQGGKDQTAAQSKPALKKGFFDAKPSAGKAQAHAARKQDTIPVLKGKKEALASGGKVIPDFLKIEPSEEDKQREAQYAQVKGQLLQALKPTQDTVSKVQADPELLACFDDPEVMAATADIEQDPRNFKKYEDNKKVMAFYASFSKALCLDEKMQGIMAARQGHPPGA